MSGLSCFSFLNWAKPCTHWSVFTHTHTFVTTTQTKTENISSISEGSFVSPPNQCTQGLPLLLLYHHDSELHINAFIQYVPLCITSFTQCYVCEFHPCCCMNPWFVHFHCCAVFQYMNIPHFIYSFYCWRTFRVFPGWGYYNKAAMIFFKQPFYLSDDLTGQEFGKDLAGQFLLGVSCTIHWDVC